MNTETEAPFAFDPGNGHRYHEAVFSAQWFRSLFPDVVWTHNPWTGSPRPPGEIGADPCGHRLTPVRAPLSHYPGAPTPPTPASYEAETLRRVSQALQHASTEVATFADKATKLQDECSRLRVENERLRRGLQWVEYRAKKHGSEALPDIAKSARRVLDATASPTPAGEAQASTEPSPHMRAAADHEPDSLKQEGEIFDMATAPLDHVPVYLHFEDGSKIRAYHRSTFEDGPKAWGTGPNFTDRVARTPIGWSPVPSTPHMRAAAGEGSEL